MSETRSSELREQVRDRYAAAATGGPGELWFGVVLSGTGGDR